MAVHDNDVAYLAEAVAVGIEYSATDEAPHKNPLSAHASSLGCAQAVVRQWFGEHVESIPGTAEHHDDCLLWHA